MRTLLLSALAMVLGMNLNAQGLRITSVNPQTNEITLKNFGGTSVDIANYRFCSLFSYDGLSSAAVSVQQGDFMLASNEEVSVIWDENTGMNAAGADLALYFPVGAFTDPSAMVDFVQWGSAGNGRENVADAAGIWVAGTFVTGDVPYVYTGDGAQNGVEFWSSGTGSSTVVINEVDSDNAGTDTMEFIELFGEANEALDGMVLVFLNGSTDVSYAAYDLDGYTLDANGFFVIGNQLVPNVGLVFPDNSLQNGPDAVALYFGDAEDWPTGTPLSTANLIDAMVYDTSDADDLELLTLLNPGQPQVDENANSMAVSEANARIPDGGTQLNSDTYVQQLPTPGASNVIICLGGMVSVTGQGSSAIACVNYDTAELEFENTSSTGDASYLYLITDENNLILQVLDGTNSYDFAGESVGVCRLWGLSYTGTLDAGTLEAGDDATAIAGGDCLSFSSNFVEITKEECAPNTCDGGTISSSEGDGSVVVCLDEESDIISFSNTSATPEAQYLYLATDTDNNILFIIDTDSYDFNQGPELTCRVWGLSFTGALVEGSFDEGVPAGSIQTNGDCLSLSENFITVIKQSCVITNGCSDLFFSEYLEGSSFNKALEIYNPTSAAVDLSQYEIKLYPNGATEAQNTFVPEGTLAPGDVYVIANSQATSIILNVADATASVTFFNGDDAIELVHNGVVIDVIGVVGEDPGDNWVVGNGSTGEHTLVRQIQVTEGTPSWSESVLQWDVFPQDNFSSIGSHTAFPCIVEPQIAFTTSVINVSEAEASVSFSVQGVNLESAVNATISLVSATATADEDYQLTLPIDLVIDPLDTEPQSFTMTILNDELEEGTENIILSLTNADGVVVTIAELTINILDDDMPIEVLDIIEVTGVDENGVAESIGLECELRGIVHGVNMRTTGLQFTLIDATDGIGVFSGTEDFGYTVLEGDSIHVVGTIEQFNGLTQINLSALTYVSSDNNVNAPEIVDALDESTESQVVQLKCVALVDPAEWTNTGAGFNVTVSNGSDEFTVRIDAEVELYGTPAPVGVFTISGIGGQFDSSSPYDSGYQLLPRYAADFLQGPVPGYSVESGLIEECIEVTGLGNGFNVALSALDEDATSYSWSMTWAGGNELESTGQSTSFADGFGGTVPETASITLTTAQGGCTATSEEEFCVLVVGIEEQERILRVYPNPSAGMIWVQSDRVIERIELLNELGQVVLSREAVNAPQLNLDLSNMASGIYMIRMTDSQGQYISRLIKE